MKILICFILLLTTIPDAYSQQLSFEKKLKELETKRLNKRNGIKSSEQSLTGLEKDRGDNIGYTPEWSYFYLLSGTPLISYNNDKFFGNSFGLGHRRFAKNFLYGLEYNSTKKKDILDMNDISLQLGYQFTWKHRFKPFISFGLGTTKIKDLERKLSAQGYKNSIELGFDIKRKLPFHFFTGMRYNLYNFDNKAIDEVTSQEFYFTIGFEF